MVVFVGSSGGERGRRQRRRRARARGESAAVRGDGARQKRALWEGGSTLQFIQQEGRFIF